ncbi:hypothetical protein CI109_101716 [Kwoniella shandongensis]|uniref:Uncharacterized protein n=1 Tax=Kwoniella shandongensis TaxID=1734106 RepID=A0A5M6C6J7_9TREE|nr:uncharacterized protein CI109_001161 [Kwoniella shandongensis]KAA5530360.1 hypothetical protein CI109_001161 [Kwoniella shandongensis]
MQSDYPHYAHAGPSRPRDHHKKPSRPFVSAEHRPEGADGIFRVVLITSGSVASIKAPDIVGALMKSPDTAVQVVATKASSHFYTQDVVDQAVRKAVSGDGEGSSDDDMGVRVWTDEDEWSDWKKIGDPILHIELRRWADLVVVAPCSADMLAKIAGGLCDSLATSLLRALSPFTPVILCPAMNTNMYSHPFTAKHLKVVREELGYLISGPQDGGKLACGDEGAGKMTDWRDIVSLIEGYASAYKMQFPAPNRSLSKPSTSESLSHTPDVYADLPREVPTITPPPRPPTPPTPNRLSQLMINDPYSDANPPQRELPRGQGALESVTGCGTRKKDESASVKDWRSMADGNGGTGVFWTRKWWIG